MERRQAVPNRFTQRPTVRMTASIDRYILPVVVLIIFVSVLPILIEIIRERKKKRSERITTAVGVVAAAAVAGLAESAAEIVEDRPESHHPAHRRREG